MRGRSPPLYTFHFTVFTLHFTFYTLHFTFYVLLLCFALYSLQFTLISLGFTLQCTAVHLYSWYTSIHCRTLVPVLVHWYTGTLVHWYTVTTANPPLHCSCTCAVYSVQGCYKLHLAALFSLYLFKCTMDYTDFSVVAARCIWSPSCPG